MCYIHEDGAKFIREECRIARKARRCYECNRVIEPGEAYIDIVGLWDTFQSMPTCEGCDALREFIAKQERARGCIGIEAYPPFGGLWEGITDMRLDGTPYAVAPFIPEPMDGEYDLWLETYEEARLDYVTRLTGLLRARVVPA